MPINSFISEIRTPFVVVIILEMKSIHRLVLIALIGIFFITDLGDVHGQQGILCCTVKKSYARKHSFSLFSFS